MKELLAQIYSPTAINLQQNDIKSSVSLKVYLYSFFVKRSMCARVRY